MKNYCEWCHQADDWLCPKIEIPQKIGHPVHCPKCEREILLVTITRAARIAGVSTQSIYDWIRKGYQYCGVRRWPQDGLLQFDV
jgi:hypothetical protein